MKLPWEKRDICRGITAFLTVAASILFYMILKKWDAVSGVLSLIFKSLRPITYGLILAYVLNPLMNMIEKGIVLPAMKKLFKKSQKKMKSKVRTVSIILTWAVALLLILALVDFVVPEIAESIESLISSLPEYTNKTLAWGEELLKKNPMILDYLEKSVSGFSTNISDIAKRVREILPNINTVILGVSSGVYGLFQALLNILVGVIVSVYILKDKEKFVAQIKRIFYSVMSLKKANNVIALCRLTHDKFGNFITGKIFDSIIIGILCFIILTVFSVPYCALVSVIVGVTNVIPFFGPFIGAIPSALLILFVDPVKCLTFIIIIIILQQFDGNILGPKILGSTTGVSSFWVMFSILIGSGLFGVWGMVCAVPMFAVIYTLVSESCHKALKRKGIDYTGETYENIDHIDENTNAPKWLDED